MAHNLSLYVSRFIKKISDDNNKNSHENKSSISTQVAVVMMVAVVVTIMMIIKMEIVLYTTGFSISE